MASWPSVAVNAKEFAMKWRPISEATTTKSLEEATVEILAWIPPEPGWPEDGAPGYQVVCWWEPFLDDGCWYDGSNSHEPSHWIALPRPPEEAR